MAPVIAAIWQLVGYLVVGGGVVGATAYLSRKASDRHLTWILFGALSVRVGFIAVASYFGVLVGRNDSLYYHRQLTEAASLLGRGTNILDVFSVTGETGLYELLFAPVYHVFGTDPVLVRLLMAFLGVLVVYNTYRLTLLLSRRRAALYSASLAAFFPYFIYLSGLLYRDMLIVFLLSEAIYLLSNWFISEDRPWALLGAVVFGYLAAESRPENLIPLFGAFGVAVLLKVERPTTRLGLLGAGGVLFLWAFDRFIHVESVLQTLQSLRATLARAGYEGAYLNNTFYHNFLELVVFAPVGVIYFLLVPLPWHMGHPLLLVANVTNLIWYPVFLLGIFGARRLFARGDYVVIVLVAYVLVGSIGYGLVEGNIGPAMRHRVQFQFVVFTLASVSAANRLVFHVGPYRSRSAVGE